MEKSLFEILSASELDFAKLLTFSNMPLQKPLQELLTDQSVEQRLVLANLNHFQRLKTEDYLINFLPFFRIYNKTFASSILLAPCGTVPITPFNFPDFVSVLKLFLFYIRVSLPLRQNFAMKTEAIKESMSLVVYLVSFSNFDTEIKEITDQILEALLFVINSDIINILDAELVPIIAAQAYRVDPSEAMSMSDPFVKVCRKVFGLFASSVHFFDDKVQTVHSLIYLNMMLCSETHCIRVLEGYNAAPLITTLVELMRKSATLPLHTEHDKGSVLNLVSRLPIDTRFLCRSRLPVGSYELGDMGHLLAGRALGHLFRQTDLPNDLYITFFKRYKRPHYGHEVTLNTWAPADTVQKETVIMLSEFYYTVIVMDYRVNALSSEVTKHHYCRPLDLLGGIHINSLSEKGTLSEQRIINKRKQLKSLKKMSHLQHAEAIANTLKVVVNQEYAFPIAERLIILSLLLTRPEIPKMRDIVNKQRKQLKPTALYRTAGDMVGVFLSSPLAADAVQDFSSWTIDKRTSFQCCQDSNIVAFDSLILGLLAYATFQTTSQDDIFSDARLQSLFIVLFSEVFPIDVTIYVTIFVAYLTSLQKGGIYTLLNNLAFASCDEEKCKAPLFFMPLLINKLTSIEATLFACPWHNKNFDTRLGRYTTILFDAEFKADFFDEVSGISSAWSAIFRMHTWLMTLTDTDPNTESTINTEYEKSLALISQLTDGSCQCVIKSMDFDVMRPILIYASKNRLKPSSAAIITRFFSKNRKKLLYLPLILPAIYSLINNLPEAFIPEYASMMIGDASYALHLHATEEEVTLNYLKVLTAVMQRAALHSADKYIVKGLRRVCDSNDFSDGTCRDLLCALMRRLSSPDFHFLNLLNKVPKLKDLLLKFVKEFKQKDASIALWRYALQDRVLLKYLAAHEDLLVIVSDLAFSDNTDPQINKELPLRAGVRLISFDGGGIRGLAELYAIKEICQMTCLAPPQLFDYTAGTSAGAIIAGALFFVNMPVEIGVNIFSKLGEFIFDQRKAKNNVKAFKSRFRESYDTTLLEYLFQSIYGSRLLDQQESYPRILIASTDAHLKSQAVIFNNYHIPSHLLTQIPYIYRNRITRIEAWKAVRSSSAAPTYFKPFKIPEFSLTLSDGASVANNPSVLLLNDVNVVESDRIIDAMLSLSTGITPPVHSDTSIFSWLFAAIESWLDTTSTTLAAADICKAHKCGYYRYEPGAVINWKGKTEPIKIDEGNHKKLNHYAEMLQRGLTVDSTIFKEIAASLSAKIWVLEAPFKDFRFLGFNPKQVIYCDNLTLKFTIYSRTRTPSQSAIAQTLYRDLPRDQYGYITAYEAKEREELGDREVISEEWAPKWEVKSTDFALICDYPVAPKIVEVAPKKEFEDRETNRPGSFRAFSVTLEMPTNLLAFSLTFKGKDISGGPFLAVNE